MEKKTGENFSHYQQYHIICLNVYWNKLHNHIHGKILKQLYHSVQTMILHNPKDLGALH